MGKNTIVYVSDFLCRVQKKNVCSIEKRLCSQTSLFEMQMFAVACRGRRSHMRRLIGTQSRGLSHVLFLQIKFSWKSAFNQAWIVNIFTNLNLSSQGLERVSDHTRVGEGVQ